MLQQTKTRGGTAPLGSFIRNHERTLAKLLLAPSILSAAFFVYGFIIFTFLVSLTNSRLLPVFNFVGLESYSRLWALDNWHKALSNLFIFGALFIGICVAVGFVVAVLMDQKIKGENIFRPIFLYPMALSFIVTGTAWRWFLNPGLGLEHTVRNLGWDSFVFDWIINKDTAIYTVVMAGVWQSAGFCIAMFIAGLRSIDKEIIKAAHMDGARGARLYWRVIMPMMKPTFLSVFVIQGHLTIKSYDLVVSLTGGGPGNATTLPSTFMYDYTFTRNLMSIGSASSIMMLALIAMIIIPYLWYELRGENAR